MNPMSRRAVLAAALFAPIAAPAQHAAGDVTLGTLTITNFNFPTVGLNKATLALRPGGGATTASSVMWMIAYGPPSGVDGFMLNWSGNDPMDSTKHLVIIMAYRQSGGKPDKTFCEDAVRETNAGADCLGIVRTQTSTVGGTKGSQFNAVSIQPGATQLTLMP